MIGYLKVLCGVFKKILINAKKGVDSVFYIRIITFVRRDSRLGEIKAKAFI